MSRATTTMRQKVENILTNKDFEKIGPCDFIINAIAIHGNWRDGIEYLGSVIASDAVFRSNTGETLDREKVSRTASALSEIGITTREGFGNFLKELARHTAEGINMLKDAGIMGVNDEFIRINESCEKALDGVATIADFGHIANALKRLIDIGHGDRAVVEEREAVMRREAEEITARLDEMMCEREDLERRRGIRPNYAARGARHETAMVVEVEAAAGGGARPKTRKTDEAIAHILGEASAGRTIENGIFVFKREAFPDISGEGISVARFRNCEFQDVNLANIGIRADFTDCAFKNARVPKNAHYERCTFEKASLLGDDKLPRESWKDCAADGASAVKLFPEDARGEVRSKYERTARAVLCR